MAGGYYVVTIPNTKYKVINLNSMYCSSEDDVRKVHG